MSKAEVKKIEESRKAFEQEATKEGESESEKKVRRFKMLFAVYDALLDNAEQGPYWLKDDRIAEIFVTTLLQRYQDLYQLWAYVVMANHVHVLLEPKLEQSEARSTAGGVQYVKLSKITQALKGFSALQANRILNRSGKPFWQDESYDYWARDEAEFYRIVSYIENNPVKAGLTSKPEDWRWSSAAERRRRGYNEIKPLTKPEQAKARSTFRNHVRYSS